MTAGRRHSRPLLFRDHSPFGCIQKQRLSSDAGPFFPFRQKLRDELDFLQDDDYNDSEKRAERLMEKAQSGTMLKPIDGIAYRKEIGQIDLEVGRRGFGKQQEHGTGLAKIRQKHGRDVHALAETLAHGEIMPTTVGTEVGAPYDPNRRALVHGNYIVFLARKGNKRWRISTHYKSVDDTSTAEEIKQWLRSGDRSHLQGAAV